MMIKPIAIVFFTTLIYSFIGCSVQKANLVSLEKEGWTKETQVLKTIDNINFNFPAGGHAFDHKADFVKQCFDALQSNLQLIKLDDFTDTIQIRFLRSREDMYWLTGRRAAGIAQPHIYTLYVVADSSERVKPPIKHEFMHLIAMLKWGYPHYTSTWINEGLATLAEDNCNGYKVSQIYRYFMETDKLVHVDSLAKSFYKQPEMIGYHQSAYIVEYLLNNYKIEQFKRLWTEGFGSFESIYSIDFRKMKMELEKSVMEKHPKAPAINWETFKKGCMR